MFLGLAEAHERHELLDLPVEEGVVLDGDVLSEDLALDDGLFGWWLLLVDGPGSDKSLPETSLGEIFWRLP